MKARLLVASLLLSFGAVGAASVRSMEDIRTRLHDKFYKTILEKDEVVVIDGYANIDAQNGLLVFSNAFAPQLVVTSNSTLILSNIVLKEVFPHSIFVEEGGRVIYGENVHVEKTKAPTRPLTRELMQQVTTALHIKHKRERESMAQAKHGAKPSNEPRQTVAKPQPKTSPRTQQPKPASSSKRKERTRPKAQVKPRGRTKPSKPRVSTRPQFSRQRYESQKQQATVQYEAARTESEAEEGADQAEKVEE